jgi:hypothetical protein
LNLRANAKPDSRRPISFEKPVDTPRRQKHIRRTLAG